MSSPHPPGPRGLPYVGSMHRYLRNPLAFLMEVSEEYGDIALVRLMGLDFYILRHPEDIQHVVRKLAPIMLRDRWIEVLRRALGYGLLTSEGELWKRQRKLVSFAFTPKRVRTYADAMVREADRVFDGWGDDEVRNLHHEMQRVTMAVVGRTLFDTDVLGEANDIGQAMEAFNEYFSGSPESLLNLPLSIPTRRNRGFQRALATMNDLIYRIVAERRTSGRDHDDLLSALLHAQDDDGSQMSPEQVRDECMTLFAAGHETTALALAHSFYLLSKYPQVDARLRAELVEVLGGRPPRYEDYERLTYTEWVLKETMRLYPPAYVSGRETTEEIEIRGYTIPKGSQFMFSQWVVHRDPRWFPNPEAFIPERWAPDEASSRPRGSYFPFGDGPRVCIGNHFAMMEGVLLMARIAQRFHIELVPGERLMFRPAVTLRPRGSGLRARILRVGDPATLQRSPPIVESAAT